jgi:hypothetical protein
VPERYFAAEAGDQRVAVLGQLGDFLEREAAAVLGELRAQVLGREFPVLAPIDPLYRLVPHSARLEGLAAPVEGPARGEPFLEPVRVDQDRVIPFDQRYPRPYRIVH